MLDNIFINYVCDTIIKRKWLIIIVNVIIITFLSAMMIQKHRQELKHNEYMRYISNNPLSIDSSHVVPSPILDTDYRIWFDSTNKDLLRFDYFQRMFSKEDNLIIVVCSKSGNIFTNENLISIRDIIDTCWKVPYVTRVSGLNNFNYTYAESESEDDALSNEFEDEEDGGDNLVVEDLISSLPLSNDALETKKKQVLNDPLIPRFLISPEGDLTQITITTNIPREFPLGFDEVRNYVQGIKRSIELKNPDLNIKLSGTVMLNSSFMEFANNDFRTLIPIMYLFIFVFLFCTFRTFWGTLLPVVVITISVTFPVFIFVAVFGYSLTNITINTMQILTAVAIADSVHFLSVFNKNFYNGSSKVEAICISIKKNFIPCFLTTLTTSIGFYSLLLQDLPPFNELGLFSGTGTLFAFITTFSLLPALILVLPFKQVKQKNVKVVSDGMVYRLLGVIEPFTFKYQRIIRIVSLVTTIAGVIYASNIIIDSTTIKYFKEGSAFRVATEYIDENIIGTNPVDFSFDSGKEYGINDPEFLKKIERFSTYISEHDSFDITYVSSVVDVIKRLNQAMHNGDTNFYRIPEGKDLENNGSSEAKQLISQYLLLYTLSLPQGMDINNQISLDQRYARVTVYVKSISSAKQLALIYSLNKWIKTEIPEVKAYAVGVPVMFGNLMKSAIPGMLKSLIMSLLFITLTIAITFRSVKIAMYSMIPNIWPLIVVFGCIGAFGYVVDLSVSVVGMITLGIAVDDTIHFLTKYIYYLNRGMEVREAIAETFMQVGKPLLFTSIILIAGFGVLIFSQFNVNANMGIFSTTIIALALIADFIILPSVLYSLKIKNKNAII